MGDVVFIANHHTGQYLFPKEIVTGSDSDAISKPTRLYHHTILNPGTVTPVDAAFWKKIKETKQIQHLLKIGKLEEVKERQAADEMPVFQGPTNDPEIPDVLKDPEPEVTGTIAKEKPATAKARQTGGSVAEIKV